MRNQKMGSKTPPFNEIPPWRQRLPRAVQIREYDAMTKRLKKLARECVRVLPIGFDPESMQIPQHVLDMKAEYDVLQHKAKVFAQLYPWVR